MPFVDYYYLFQAMSLKRTNQNKFVSNYQRQANSSDKTQAKLGNYCIDEDTVIHQGWTVMLYKDEISKDEL